VLAYISLLFFLSQRNYQNLLHIYVYNEFIDLNGNVLHASAYKAVLRQFKLRAVLKQLEFVFYMNLYIKM
jgi:hypothetical protein